MNKDMTPAPARDFWYDNAKALLIVLVVVGHLATSSIEPARAWVTNLGKFIYVFHMPVFMVISGRFSKHRIEKGQYAKAAASLLAPYIFLHIGMLLLYSVLDVGIPDATLLKPKFGLWYFLTLFLYLVITPTLKKHRLLMPAALMAAVLAFFLPNPLYGAFHRAVTFYPFFLFGYYGAGRSFSMCRRPWFRAASVLFYLALFLWMLYKGDAFSLKILYLNTTIGHIEGDYLAIKYLLRYGLCFLCFFFLMGLVPTKKHFFTYVGTHSVYVYALHLFVVQWLRKGLPVLFLPDKFAALALLAGGVLLAFLLAAPPVRKLFRPVLQPQGRLLRRLEKVLPDKEPDETSV